MGKSGHDGKTAWQYREREVNGDAALSTGI